MNNKMKKLVSALTVTSIIGTSIVAPFNVLSDTTVKAAVSATAPIYTAPTQQPASKNFSKTNISAYLPLIEFYDVYLEIDMTKIAKGYGLQVKLPDGTIHTQYSTTAAGVSEKMYVDVLNQKYNKNTRISINVIYPDGKILEQNDAALTAADFVGDFENGLQDFGQKVYNLYQNSMLATVATEITQADVDAAENAALTVEDSAEKARLLVLLNEAHQQFDTNMNLQIKQQNEKARQAVNELFLNNTPTSGAIKPSLSQFAVNTAKALVNQLPDSPQKQAMLADVQMAQTLLNSLHSTLPPSISTDAANAILGLFTNNNPSTNVLKPTTDQQAINDVQKLVDAVVDTTVKASMQKDLDKAQNLLNATKTPVNFDLTVAPFKLGKDNYVTGQFSGDVAKISLTVNNNTEGSKISVTGPDFKYYANNVIRSQTDTVKLTAYDSNGKVLGTKTVTVTKDAPTGAISSITPFQLGKDGYVTGTFTGDIVKVELQVNKVPLQRINVTGGTIKYYAKPNITKTTDVVELVAFNAAGDVVSTKAVTFASTGTGSTNGNVTVNPFLLGTDGYVKGQFTGDVTKISLTVNNVKGSTISVPTTGPDFQYYAKTVIKNRTDMVVLTAYNALGGVIKTVTVPVL
ncbi:immunoglobulin-like domain-containing protein [Listeria rocourtiae]|uniref:immunoglobulin-like domain-containing protein n=1 Tax=Listeria rocourtiae TaxID=647910 RepID=UPI003D2F55A3